jgi:hypothetical protein
MRGGESIGGPQPSRNDPPDRTGRIHRALCAFAVAILAGHHVGTAVGWLGGPGETRWADWVDLAVPYAVVGFAAATLPAARASRRDWVLFWAFALLYTQGHGVHLAANSIANVDPSDAAHLWDETVGHWLWYTGLAGIVAALALALDRVPAPRRLWSVPLALAFGFTVFTNSVEGGTAVLGLVTGAVFTVWGARRIGRAPEVLVPAYLVAFACLAAWGAYWRGFPQFSELGWI